MFISDAYAQTAAADAGMGGAFMQVLPLVLILAVFYFLLIRPQQKRLKAHQEMVANLKRGDVVVTSGGLIGKIRSVDEMEARIELAPNMEVRVVRATISEVRSKSDPSPANDTKPASAD